jgi:hypothetical protein
MFHVSLVLLSTQRAVSDINYINLVQFMSDETKHAYKEGVAYLLETWAEPCRWSAEQKLKLSMEDVQ